MNMFQLRTFPRCMTRSSTEVRLNTVQLRTFPRDFINTRIVYPITYPDRSAASAADSAPRFCGYSSGAAWAWRVSRRVSGGGRRSRGGVACPWTRSSHRPPPRRRGAWQRRPPRRPQLQRRLRQRRPQRQPRPRLRSPRERRPLRPHHPHRVSPLLRRLWRPIRQSWRRRGRKRRRQGLRSNL